MNILVTGVAGFIGFSVTKQLLARGDTVVGIDNLNDYYDPALKQARLQVLRDLSQAANFTFIQQNLADKSAVDQCFAQYSFDRVIHLAAQAGVRYSIENPHSYVESNLIAFTNILEACRYAQAPHLVYASTSSVYGANTQMPFSEQHGVNHPIQFYAATKRANELMAHSYSHLFNLPTTGLRFFTVYGPWGRPDMAPIKFTKDILAGTPIKVFNNGNHSRDFTFIDDIVEGIIRTSDKIAAPNPDWDSNRPDAASSFAPYRLFNIGNNSPVALMDFIKAIETATGKQAILELLPLQSGDVPDTFADSSALANYTGYQPSTSIQHGVNELVKWYRHYYQV